jgi:hypothetical protein
LSDATRGSRPVASPDALVRNGRYRRSKYGAAAFIGLSESEVREVLGPPDSEVEGRHWSEGGKHFSRLPSGKIAENTVWGPVPILAPGTPYVEWCYDFMVDWTMPESHFQDLSDETIYDIDPSQTWLLYLRDVSGAGARTVFTANSHPRDIQF